MAALQAAGIESKLLDGLKLEGNKLTFDYQDTEGKPSRQEASYFGTTDEKLDDKSSALKKQNIFYKATPLAN
ncbi:MAG: hypothetical protein Q4B28_07590 [bacterium]|nr:hypothetical protein [bacterium]